MTRLAIIVSHPIQYYAPLFRELATRCDLRVFYAQSVSADQQGAAGFGRSFDWDVDLHSGFESEFLENVSARPGPSHFGGADTPRVGARLAAGRFDAVLVMGWYLKSFIQAVLAAKRLGIPVMVRGDSQLGDPGVRSAIKAAIYPRLLRAFDAALFVGDRSRAFYQAYRYPAERLFFSPHCVDNAWFNARATPESGEALRQRLGIALDEKVILFAGKLVPFKRPLDILDAWPQMKSQPQILIAGSGELDQPLVAGARALGAPLHRLGFLNQSEMPAAYAASNLLVLPSNRRETWGLVANEALACRLPVVISDACGCAPDLALDEHAGRVFTMGAVGALAAAVDEVLTNPPARSAIASRSDAFSIAVAAEGVERALSALKCNATAGTIR